MCVSPGFWAYVLSDPYGLRFMSGQRCDVNRETFYHFLARSGNVNTCSVVIDHLISDDENLPRILRLKDAAGNTLLHAAAYNGNLAEVRTRVRPGSPLSSARLTAQRCFCSRTHAVRWQTCGERCAEVKSEGSHPKRAHPGREKRTRSPCAVLVRCSG